jgi:signal transduction histidine kinase
LRRAAKHLHVIEQQADRIGHLISDLSDVSRIQRGQLQLEPTVFDLVPVITVAIEQQQPNLATHRIILKSADEPLIVRADPQRIQQLLGNLLSNAAKASPLADRIDVTIERHGEGVRLTVRDTGIGIAPEEQSRIFERFYRTAGGGSGLGLGLYIAQQIAQHSNGTLTVESEAGNGSVFCLALPLAQPDGSTDDEY